jgi:peptidoglycan-N-acetylglucosamine deacetylase
MSVYARRRLLAVASALLIAGGLALGFTLLTGAGHGGGSSEQGPIGVAAVTVAKDEHVAPELAAGAQRAVAQPSSYHGDGPLFEVRGPIVQRVVPPFRKGRVALTFDDGPGPFTLQILAELQSLHAHATFFVIGRNAKAEPDVVRAERAAGMVVGDHTWTHPDMTKLSLAGQRWQIRTTQNLLATLIGQRPRFFRPPMWEWNRTTARVVAEQGMTGVLFSIDTQDWRLPGVTAIVRRSLAARDGQIIALHDAGGDREETLQALPLIIKGLRARGLEPVTLDQLFRKSGPKSSA